MCSRTTTNWDSRAFSSINEEAKPFLFESEKKNKNFIYSTLTSTPLYYELINWN